MRGRDAGPRAALRGGAHRMEHRSRRLGLVLLAALAVALFAAFVVLALLTGPDSALSAADRRVAAAFEAWRTDGRSHLFWLATLLGNYSLLAALSFSSVLLLAVWGRRARALLVAVGLLGAWGISEAAKAIVGRARPPAAQALIDLPHSRSLPSGHALTTLAFIGVLVFLAWRWSRGFAGREGAGPGWAAPGPALTVTIAAAGVAALIGVSRVYLGVHWLTDVLADWCLAGAWLVALLGFLRPVWRRWTGRPGGPGPRVGRSLGRHAPAVPAVRIGAVMFAVALCIAVAVLTAVYGPLLRDM